MLVSVGMPLLDVRTLFDPKKKQWPSWVGGKFKKKSAPVVLKCRQTHN